MVAVITGNTFGLSRSSAAVLGSSGLLGSAAMGRGNDNVYVDGSSGNLVVERTDEILTGRGADEDLGLTYNSEDPSTLFGTASAWNISADRRLVSVTGT